LGESILRYKTILEPEIYVRWYHRLQRQADYLYKTITLDFANINYPACCAYAMALLGRILNNQDYINRGQELARGVVTTYFTNTNKLLFGEGRPRNALSPKGCLSMDIGYNVEESLPGLALYGLLQQDEEVLQPLIESMAAHLQFMLPDGAWDNSMGTRNYKWTYWGTRNAEGCQPAYALLANRHPQFLEAAHRNLKMLQSCTFDGVLYGGPHVALHREQPSLHHTFCHAKALATVLDFGVPLTAWANTNSTIPRDADKGVVDISDMQTWLVSKGSWRATVTAYDSQAFSNTHATGGALSALYHLHLGPLFMASTNQYRLIEATNMQMDKDPHSISLTPRLELSRDDQKFTNISDLSAKVECLNDEKSVILKTTSRLVNSEQNSPGDKHSSCFVNYRFNEDWIEINLAVNKFPHAETTSLAQKNSHLSYIFPIISKNSESIKRQSARHYEIQKANRILKVEANCDIKILPTGVTNRIFHFSPGMEAIPFAISLDSDSPSDVTIRLSMVATGE
jgi:hypothetical protein